MIKIISYPKVDEWTKLQQRPAVDQSSLFEIAEDIFNDVQLTGDFAVSKYSLQFDGYEYNSSSIELNFIKDAESKIPATLKESMLKAYQNIYKFHTSQVEAIQKI